MNEREQLIAYWEQFELAYDEYLRPDKATVTETIAALRQQQGEPVAWIPVSERLPEPERNDITTSFLVWTDSQFNPQIATFCTQWDYPWCLQTSSKRVTHWQPLPEPPKAMIAAKP